ncbi:recombinase family protein [Bacillus sp. B1-b2]|uniref:recombinase family protein n=1 Tax=Bacillus sp. B1-b2 TaxID=2653201 RepID=UPI001261F72F|nr:recombinase family protein [Bacillus sp. B1-b2]KAB7672545.1 recombinase family protein [Bacillus sp. B1-b2]
MENQEIRAAIYCRTTANNYINLYDQQQKLKKYTNKMGITQIEIFQDMVNSQSFKNRPALNQLLQLTYEKQFDVVIIDSLSRISRYVKECEKICNELYKNNVTLIVHDLICGGSLYE